MSYKVPGIPQEVLWLKMFNLNLTKILEVTLRYQENTRERRTTQFGMWDVPQGYRLELFKRPVSFFFRGVCVGEGWGVLD